MNSAVTREKNLLNQCKNNANALIRTLRANGASHSDIASVTLVTEKMDELLDAIHPVKTTVMDLLRMTDDESRKINDAAESAWRPYRSSQGVARIGTAVTLICPTINAVVEGGAQARLGGSLMFRAMQLKYSR